MTKRLVTFAIVLNSLGLVAFLVALTYSATFLGAAGRLRVTELDRAGVFLEPNLRKYDPALASNVRANVTRFIVQDYREAIVTVVSIGIGITFGSMVLLIAARRNVRMPR